MNVAQSFTHLNISTHVRTYMWNIDSNRDDMHERQQDTDQQACTNEDGHMPCE